MAYTAEIQGDLGGQIEYTDLFSFDDYRLLAGIEYWAKYNLGHDVPWESRLINEPSGQYYDKVANSTDRGMQYRTVQHPTDIGALNAPTAVYYRFKELVPERIQYLKLMVEAQTTGLDTLAFARAGNHEDLKFSWDVGYGGSYMDVMSGTASRRFSKESETLEGRGRNSTSADVAVLLGNTTISFPLFADTVTKPMVRLEARSAERADITVSNMVGVVAEYHVPASDGFSTVFLNTTLSAPPGRQFLYLSTMGDIEVARFNLTGAEDTETPFVETSQVS